MRISLFVARSMEFHFDAFGIRLIITLNEWIGECVGG